MKNASALLLPLLLAATVLTLTADPASAATSSAAVRSDSAPRPVSFWLQSARHATEPAQRISYLEDALASLRGGRGAREADPIVLGATAAVAAWHLDELLAAGLQAEALEAFAGPPEAVRARLTNGAALASEVEGVAVAAPRIDLRIELAAAAVLQGDEPRARALLAGVPASLLAPLSVPGSDSKPAETDRALVEP